MSTPATERLVSVRAKVERAKHHVRDLESRISAFREANPDLLRRDQDAEASEEVVRLQREVPADFSLIVGDAVHNMRTALDHLACRLVEAYSNGPIDRVSFPVYETAAKFENRPKAQIEGASPDAVRLIESVQPYQSGYGQLGVLSKLDNTDKHRLLLVVAYGVRGLRFSGSNPSHPALQDPTIRAMIDEFRAQTTNPAFIRPGERLPMVLQGGAEVIRMSWPDGPPPQMVINLHLAYEIAFAQPEVVEGQPVVPLLTQLSQFVDGVVNQFAPLL